MVGGILLILGVSLAFTNYLIDAEVPQALFSWINEFVKSKLAFASVMLCYFFWARFSIFSVL